MSHRSKEAPAAQPDYGQRRLRGSYPHHLKPQACTQHEVQVVSSQLPFCCPQPEQRVWDAHPRVYLPLSVKQQQEVCPYCGTIYRLVSTLEEVGGSADHQDVVVDDVDDR